MIRKAFIDYLATCICDDFLEEFDKEELIYVVQNTLENFERNEKTKISFRKRSTRFCNKCERKKSGTEYRCTVCRASR